MCNEQDDFCDGNSSEELCKHCLDHCCEECFNQLKTDMEYERNKCNDCYYEDFFNLPKNLYKSEPQCFTFSYKDIKEYEEDCRMKKIIEDTCEKRKQEKIKQKYDRRWRKALSKLSREREIILELEEVSKKSMLGLEGLQNQIEKTNLEIKIGKLI
jgi:hypothetical protein